MFTIGIFTTHLPYIAFVAFYAFFLLFGVSKASSGEFHSGENRILPEFYDGKMNIHFGESEDAENHYFSFSGIFSPGSNKISVFREKIKNCAFQPSEKKHFSQFAVLFSRPPPCFS